MLNFKHESHTKTYHSRAAFLDERKKHKQTCDVKIHGKKAPEIKENPMNARERLEENKKKVINFFKGDEVSRMCPWMKRFQLC